MKLVPSLLVTVMLIAACGGRAPRDSTEDVSADSTRSTATAPSTTVEPTESTETADVDTTTTSTSILTTTTRAGTRETSSTTANTTTTARTPDAYTPPDGTYHYDVVGTTQNSGVLGGREEALPESSTDTVDVTRTSEGQRVTTVTRFDGENSQQEVTVDVTSDRAELVALNQRVDNGAATVAMTPEPPALLARLPYRVGDGWEIAWTDDASGVSGTGTGEVLRNESIATPAGRFDAVVIHVNQRLRGTVDGTLDVTVWIDRTTGIQAKQHLVTEFNDATGSSRTDATRTLREGPV